MAVIIARAPATPDEPAAAKRLAQLRMGDEPLVKASSLAVARSLSNRPLRLTPISVGGSRVSAAK
jgi:hypothetical protein